MPRVGEYCASIAMPPPFQGGYVRDRSAVYRIVQDLVEYLYSGADQRGRDL